MKRVLWLCLVFSLLLSCTAFAVDGSSYYDMPPQDHWAYPGIAYCVENGLMKGVDEHSFQPDGITTRAQLVTILWRMAGCPSAKKNAPGFYISIATDLTEDWYMEAVHWALDVGLAKGYVDPAPMGEISFPRFEPNNPVIRAEMVTFFERFTWRVLGMDVSKRADISAFPDAGSVGDWALNAMGWAIAAGVIHGSEENGQTFLYPSSYTTRAQMATVFLNYSLFLTQSSANQ